MRKISSTMMKNSFPKDFIWGTSTSAYQIEGGWDADGKGESIWDRFAHTPGKIARGENGDTACDHYHRWQEDLDILKRHNINNYRFSISWPRIFPEGIGSLNQKGVDFYNRLIDGMMQRNITPWTTMYHWDLPQSLQDKGGWTNREIVSWMEEYAHALVRLFGDRVKNWMIINEPSVISYMGHAQGLFAPGIRDEKAYWQTVHNLNLANGHVYKSLKAPYPGLSIGTTYTPIPVKLHPDYELTEENGKLLRLWSAVWNENFFGPAFKGQYPDCSERSVQSFIQEGDMETCRCDFDFVGLQHYSPIYFRPDPGKVLGVNFTQGPPHLEVSDAGWEIDPGAFRDCLLQLREEYGDKNWIITENGIALNDNLNGEGDIADDRRIDYLKRYIGAVHEARERGMTIGGYFVWSYLDNIEWASGYDLRFGLVHVDYQTLKRTPKKSLRWYRDFIDIKQKEG